MVEKKYKSFGGWFRITLERQIQMQNAMRERMVAGQVAAAREM